ncbi:sigma-70 family RNA polymerase sigma factor [Nocardiopsis dassonvillei]|uniref:sigma-70 family RNA polymerase sigma factor n=1 Tax=Nocardiopsis dassonvillei TaxID=2014 RepID=UPI0020A4D6A3|nr:sigma-70 family RNA polymerase sigma factor [Nocardiopsis dassonvillei]MCP3012352.1 sigma-70 family RNA polymerase sigma factor [Nocardiopsis dassonvillei]
MNTDEIWAARFEEHRALLRSIAHRMLGSAGEAEDAVQETWLRLNRSDAHNIDNLAGWLTTVVGRVCLDMLRSRASRREDPVGEDVPEPSHDLPQAGPEQQALLADSVGMALLVVLDMLTPAERLAFVLHDLFAMPFDQIAPILERTPAATRQLASRARRRVRGANADGVPDPVRRHRLVEAFLAAARGGDFEGLMAVLAPDVVVSADEFAVLKGVPAATSGAEAVAGQAITFSRLAQEARVVSVDGLAWLVGLSGGRPYAALAFTVEDDRIVGIRAHAEPGLLASLV